MSMPTPLFTGTPLAAAQSDGNFSKLYLAVAQPQVLFTGSVGGVGLTANLDYYNFNSNLAITGSATVMNNVVANWQDITLWVGSAINKYDYGMVRVTSVTASGSTTYNFTVITSEVNMWQLLVDHGTFYITGINTVDLWPKQANFLSGVFYCNDDQPYDHQQDGRFPIVQMGPDLLVNLDATLVTTTTFFNVSAWLPPYGEGASISSYAWSWVGPDCTIANATNPTTNISFYNVGTYRLIMRVTATSGSASYTSSAYRTVVVTKAGQSNYITDFELLEAAGDIDTGGWHFSAKIYSSLDYTAMPERTKVFLGTVDYYNGLTISPITSVFNYDRYNVSNVQSNGNALISGWICKETMELSAELSTFTIEVQGPHWWLQKMASWPAGIRNVLTSATNWNEYKGFTYQSFVWHVMMWRTTAGAVMDVFQPQDWLSVDSYAQLGGASSYGQMIGATAPWGNIWGQITDMGSSKGLVKPCCNRLGQMYLQVETNLMPPEIKNFSISDGTKGKIDVIQDITKKDWSDGMTIEIVPVQQVAYLDTAAITYSSGSVAPYRSGAWGLAMGHYGVMQTRTELVVPYTAAGSAAGQTSANRVAGVVLGDLNTRYTLITIHQPYLNRWIDFCPNCVCTMSMAASDNPRGIVWTNQLLIPRSVELQWNAQAGTLITSIVFASSGDYQIGKPLPFYSGPLS